MNDVSVVILAAGQGTRMKSRLPKVLHGAGGKTLIRHAIDAALEAARPERIFVVVGHQADAVRAEDAEAAGVQTVQQTEQLGTGHAVMCAADRLANLAGQMIVTVGDCPLIQGSTLAALAKTQGESGAAAVVITTEVPDPTGYGRIIRDEAAIDSGDVREIVEHKVCTVEQRAVREINSGIFCFDSAAFWKHVHEIQPNNPAGEYYLTDMVAILRGAGKRVAAMKVADASQLLGINNRVELAAADRILRERKIRQLMLDGVTIEKPETVTVDSQVRIGMDSVIEPFAQITGDTIIGENCRIGGCSIINGSVLGDSVEVFPFSMVLASRLDTKVQVGPFARIRMGAHLEEDVHIGNFVEVKKSRIGAGTKSMHLAYLGDAEIGAKVNVGAGTITCNYDGQRKHPTRIGDRVFVGSNSTLVAPLEIEHDSYIAAASVVTHKVPAGALAVGRARQINKEGWKRKSIRPKPTPESTA